MLTKFYFNQIIFNKEKQLELIFCNNIYKKNIKFSIITKNRAKKTKNFSKLNN